jgi:TolB protein
VGYDGNDQEIYTINVGDGSRLNVTDNSTDDYYPDYAPNGKRIAYTNYAGAGAASEIYTINPDGGGKRPVTDNSTDDYDPYWGRQ